MTQTRLQGIICIYNINSDFTKTENVFVQIAKFTFPVQNVKGGKDKIVEACHRVA